MTPQLKSSLPPVFTLFCDGASSGNPGPGGWAAILVTPEGQVRELGGGVNPTTNNQMELTSVIQGLLAISAKNPDLAEASQTIRIYSDSSYVIRGATQWVKNWIKNGWKSKEGKPIANIEYWEQLLAVLGSRKVSWHYVRGHSGIPGNERADEIAVLFSQNRAHSPLYQGRLENYGVDIFNIPEDTQLPSGSASSGKGESQKPYSYLSLIGNVPLRHGTWAECERRVKGHPGAKFRKTMTAAEEEEILRSWGFRLTDVVG